MANYDAIFIMGPQGSGKGTQAKILEQKLGFFYWEMGGILRSMENYQLSNGKTIGSIIHEGTLLTDEELAEVISEKLSTLPSDQGIIFDGIPRRLGQAEFMIRWLEKEGRRNLATIFLDVPREESLKRLERRAEVEHRADDTPEKIERRLKQYEEVTVPVLGYMREHTAFLDIDGRPSIPEVTKEIAAALLIA
jgi:adenylate kinase